MDAFQIPVASPNFPPLLKFEDGSLKSNFDLGMLMPFTLATNLYDELTHRSGEGSRQAILTALDQLKPAIDEPALAQAVERATAYIGGAQTASEEMRLAILAAQMCYPVHHELYGYFAESPADEYRVQDPGDYPTALQASTLQELLTTLFGCYRKDLAKAVVRSSEGHLLRAWLHSGSMPVDWIIDYLRTSDPEDTPMEFTLNAPAYRAMTSVLKPGDSKRVLYDTDPLIEDTVAMWGGNGERSETVVARKKVKSIRDLHDRLLTLERKSCHSEYVIPEGVPKALEALKETFSAEDLEAEIIRNSSQAADVGAALRNCCGASFNREAGEAGAIAFVVLHRANKPYALASFAHRNGSVVLRELKANANTPMPELEVKLKEHLSTQAML